MDVSYKGMLARQYAFHNVPQQLFLTAYGSRLGGEATDFSKVQEKNQIGWGFQSADYTITLADIFSTPRLVAESLRWKLGDGSGYMYVTWETEWSNFNMPVTIRQPEE
jgi:hypothetical protein